MALVLPIAISAVAMAATVQAWAMWPWVAVAARAGTMALWATGAAGQAVGSSLLPAAPAVQPQLAMAPLAA